MALMSLMASEAVPRHARRRLQPRDTSRRTIEPEPIRWSLATDRSGYARRESCHTSRREPTWATEVGRTTLLVCIWKVVRTVGNGGDLLEVLDGWRARDRPFERYAVPRIGGRLLAPEYRVDDGANVQK